MSANASWKPFGITDDLAGQVTSAKASRNGTRVVNLTLRGRADDDRRPDRAGSWLRNAMIALAVLAAAAAVVSFEAQYRMVQSAKHAAAVAALEAGIPDVSALIFASLGVALALHGKRAIRARVLNVGAVVTSIGMNALAAGPGWRDAAIWVMPPVAYALASDTAIGVIRAYTLARQRGPGEHLADDETTPLAVLGGVLLWLLRLALAGPSTLRGFRAWVVAECPSAPQARALTVARAAAADARADAELAGGERERERAEAAFAEASAALEQLREERDQAAGVSALPRAGTKTARFLDLVAERHGPLAGLPLGATARIATALAPEVGLHPGSARSALRARVLAAQDEGTASHA